MNRIEGAITSAAIVALVRTVHSWGKCCGLFFVIVAIQGCVGMNLKNLEIEQLKSEISAVDDATTYLSSGPTLGGQYEGRLVVGGNALNRFLEVFNKYDVPLDWPSGAVLHFEDAHLDFKDGAPSLILNAKAVDRSETVEINLKIRVDLQFQVNKEKNQLEVKFAVRDILPNIKFSIFRWREFWLGMAILMLQIDKYEKTLPANAIPLSLDLSMDVNPPSTSQITVGNATVTVRTDNLPSFGLGFRYQPMHVVTLMDGIHVFFNMERTY
jgi:hypothetical protein